MIDWGAVEAIATCLLVAGIAVAIWQLWETRRRAKIEFTERRLEELNSLDIKEGLLIAYNKTPSKLSDLEKEDRDKIVQVLDPMHTLGLLVKKGYADKELAIEAHRGSLSGVGTNLCLAYATNGPESVVNTLKVLNTWQKRHINISKKSSPESNG
jgi:hypothetical protein